jgi:lysyl-tRNA synthetase class 1
MKKVIGYGTWYDKVATDIIKREDKLGRNKKNLRVESGVAASGIPHIGSFSEITRNYAVSLALKAQNYSSEFIIFSDNKDGLRKVPLGLPDYLNKYLGFPVTQVPDPYDCHDNYGDHMVNLLVEAMTDAGVKYKLIKGNEAYRDGLLNDEIGLILQHSDIVGRIIYEETGQEKYLNVLPYFPVCSSCGRIYTTRALNFISGERKILYECNDVEIKQKILKGCGYKGEIDYTKGEGKLAWKAGEFAARWRALSIRFEAYGKDISNSVKINDRISLEVLNYIPPLHVQYEMYLTKKGEKISKSVGNTLTPQIWFKYGSPQSLILLTLKRFTGTRNISPIDIPQYMDELDNLESIFFQQKKIHDIREKTKLSGLYRYCWFLNTPKEQGIHIPYNLLTSLVKVSPKNLEIKFVTDKLRNYGYIQNKVPDNLKKRIKYAINWTKDFKDPIEKEIHLNNEEINVLQQIIHALKEGTDADTIQSNIFDIARKNSLKPKNVFRILYSLLLGTTSGPRLGPYIIDMGKENAIGMLNNKIRTYQKVA